MTWQPIETAPEDKPILACGVWQGEIHGVVTTDLPAIDIICGKAERTDWDNSGGWWNCTTGDAYQCWLKPTHWMPLPDLPQPASVRDEI